MAAGDARSARPRHRDDHGRFLAGSVPGWGMSWWWHEQGLDPRNAGQITMEERFRLMRVYWAAVSDGWRPSVPREDWVGSCHPFEGGD